MKRVTGTYRTTTTASVAVQAFVPFGLPPREPRLDMTGLDELHERALEAISRLVLAGRMVPSTGWFLYGFVRKEAVITSEIEGTQATLLDVIEFEATEETDKPEDVEEVCNYVRALTYARQELAKTSGLPICTRLLCESHERLMRGVRGASKAPGQLRRAQNWIGGRKAAEAKFVPPPPEDVTGCMDQLERWVHSEDALPPLVKAGLAHVQFETIHPFLDGNGRIGRLLIALLIEHWNLMSEPLLYVSVAFRRRQSEYYARLAAVRTEGDWEGWVKFFLECVIEAAEDGVEAAVKLFGIVSEDRKRLAVSSRATLAAMQLLEMLPEHPMVTGPKVAELVKVSAPTARKALKILRDEGILKEISGKERDRVFAYETYLGVLGG